MKKRIIKYGIRVIAVIICFAVIVTVVKSVQNKSQQFGTKDTVKYTEGLEELSLSDGAVLENENLALYVDENYCISLLDKKTGKVWNSSIPEEMQKNFNVSSDAAVSSCNITYLAKDNTVVEYDSYKQSALREQIKMYAAENSVRITYIFGERTSDNIIPQAFTEKRFKEMLERCDDDQKDFLKRRYELFNAKTMKAEDNPEEKLKTFTKLKTTPLYIISDVSGKVLIEKTKKLFDDIGFESEEFGDDAVIVRSVPGEVELGEVEPLVLELVAQGEELRKELITEKNERLLYTIACKSAVKANMRMSKIEMETLVRNVLRLKNINTCPHGRPIIVTMSKKELEKEFKRIV